MTARRLLAAFAVIFVAVVVQTTLFARFRFVAPDLVLLLCILFATTELRRELVLLLAFTGGLVVDLLGSTTLGLRAAVFTVVAYVAIRTFERVDIGPVAVGLWVAALTLVGVVLFLLLGTLSGQGGLVTAGVGRRIALVPLSNLAFSFLVVPLLNRVMGREVRGVL